MRPFLHVTPLQGRLNDPNGLFIVGNTLHIFYQHDPVFPTSPKRTGWGHASVPIAGKNAWRINHHPDALYPSRPYDMQGCYSGNAVVVNESGQKEQGNRQDNGQGNGQDNTQAHKDSLAIFYTGNVKIPMEDGQLRRRTTQNLVRATNDPVVGMEFRHYPENPVIDGPAPGFTEHFRDPMVTRDYGGKRRWRMVIGAQRDDLTGGIALYRSDDLVHWTYEGEVIFDVNSAQPGAAPDILPRGYMWECPNLFRMRDRCTGELLDVLVMCPQGLSERQIDGVRHYASSDQCGYLVGKLEGTTFSVLRGFSELDYGHTFYAPQFTDGSCIDDQDKVNKKTDALSNNSPRDQKRPVDDSSSIKNLHYRRRPQRDLSATELGEESAQGERAQALHTDETGARGCEANPHKFETNSGASETNREKFGEASQKSQGSSESCGGDEAWDSAVMLGWMGLPDADDAPTVSAAGWVHSLTLPRRVVLRDHRLVQEFLPDAEAIRSCAAEVTEVEEYGPFWVQYRKVAAPTDSDVVHSVFLTDTAGSQAARIDVGCTRVSVEINGDARVADIDPDYIQGPTSIIVDGCTLEVLAGGGQIAFSSMVYPSAGETWCELREEKSSM